MEPINPAARLRALLGKYRHAVVVLLIGLGLMLLPFGEKPASEQPSIPEPEAGETDLETRLEQILSLISGAGEVDVLLTVRTGQQTLYQTNDDQDTSDTSSQRGSSTVIIEDADHQESGLVRRTDPPVYLGAVVVCQGADDPQVKLALVEAVRCATGLGADQITVVKMK